jgi:CSLREA domain-containing protein
LVWALGAVLILLCAVPAAASADVFIVNTTADLSAIPGEEVCTGVATTCTLREAIEKSNANPGPDAIRFTEVNPADPQLLISEVSLPDIFEAVTIEGDTLPGATPGVPAIELVPVDMQSQEFTTGLSIHAGEGTRVEGLAIGEFGTGIEIGPTEGGLPVDTEVCGSYLGVELNGLTARPNEVGIEVGGNPGERPEGTVIGSPGASTPCAGNVISGNTFIGALDSGFRTTIAGNSIGIGPQPSGEQLPNGTPDTSSGGIVETSTALEGMIGGTAPSGVESNVIAFNKMRGVLVESGTGEASIRHDSFFENEGLGIEITAGAPPEPPLIESAESPTAHELVVEGMVTGTEGETVEVDLYGSPACDPSGAGEGQTFLGTADVPVGAGPTNFLSNLPVEVPQDDSAITATTTREAGATSEFSTCAEYEPPPQTFVVKTLEDSFHGACGPDCSLRDAIDAANEFPNVDTIEFAVAGTIEPDEQDLPTIDEPVIVDGTSAPGYSGEPVVIVDGTEAANEGRTQGLSLSPDAAGSKVTGVAIENFEEGVLIFGDSVLESDRVAHNEGIGIFVGTPAAATAIRRTEIFANGGGSIEFETPNSVPEPVLEAFAAGSGGTSLFVPLEGALPDHEYAIDVFANAHCEQPGEHGPAEVFLGTGVVTTDGSGEAEANIPGRALTGIDAEVFTVTATDLATGITSQLGHCAYAPIETAIESKPRAVTSSTSATFTFAGVTVGHVAGFECELDSAGFSACPTPEELTGLAPGSHTFKVRATNGEGVTSVPSSYTWEVDTTPPTVSITAGPSGTTKATTAEFEFTATDSATPVTTECSLDGAAFSACTSPKRYPGLGAGPHTFEVKATDAAGNTSAPAVRAWKIQTAAPPTSITAAPQPNTESTAATFEFGEAGSGGEANGFECRLDDAAFAPCASPRSFAALAPGAHTFAVRTTDEAGNKGEPTVYTWTVSSPPQAKQETQAAFASGPAPVNGEKVVVAPEEGKVLIKLPGTNKFVPLEELKEIPVGAVIDATKGKVKLTSVDPDGSEQSASFFGGVFKVKQREGGNLVVLELLDTNVCTSKRPGGEGRALALPGGALSGRAPTVLARPSGTSGKLWGSGHGNFRTEGNQGSATVRGTIWLVEDRCDGTTFFRTRRGIVSVRDFVLHKTLPLPAGKSYVAGEG